MDKQQASFSDLVYDVVRKIPSGSVLAYGEVAALAGFPRAQRAVGALMKKNFAPDIPCHRVICSDGTVGQYNRGGSRQKQQLLIREGLSITRGKVLR